MAQQYARRGCLGASLATNSATSVKHGGTIGERNSYGGDSSRRPG
jgi:hypothetical protein